MGGFYLSKETPKSNGDILNHMWKQLSSKEIFTHPRLTIIEDRVMLPNGTETDYIKFKETGNTVTIICKNLENKILLQTEYSYPPNKEILQFPGGFIPNGEDLVQGANRELMEEEGIKANNLFLLGSYLSNNRRSNSRMYVYLGTQLEKQSLPADAEEIISSQWFTEEEIDHLIATNQIINSNVLAAWLLYKFKSK